MSIAFTLAPEQEAWIAARVAAGEFASVQDGARELIADRIAELSEGEDDLAWAKPLVDEARADLARGDTISLEEHRARNARRLAAPLK